MYIDLLLQTFSITLPVILLVALGVFLKARGQIDDAFVATSSKLVFNVSLPVLMFMAIVTADMQVSEYIPLVGFSLGAALGAFVLTVVVARLGGFADAQYGAFVQSAFRSNLGIIGLALCITAYPEQGAILGALVLAVVTPLYNLLSVWVLSSGQDDISWSKQLRLTMTNPLIVAIALAALVRVASPEMPNVLLSTGDILAGLTLPLALIGIGASLTLSRSVLMSTSVVLAVFMKLVVLPSVVVVAAVWGGFRGAELMTLALMFASPTAAAAFVMAKAMNSDSRHTADVIALSTLGSGLTVTTIIYVINLIGLV
ncbi:AEC family transporter [Thalassolituus sp.]|uniref:AEC family transporter n=1 Tax=Thalassolituus sp. TaxID=2030822 RepID=UPI0035150AAD